MALNLLWDASALAKRYTRETGSDTVRALFGNVPLSRMVTTIWGYAETFSILLRRHNGAIISATAFAKAAAALENEFIFHPDPMVLTIEDAVVLASIALMKRHNLNATDAAILALFLRYDSAVGSSVCVLVAADKRLLRAAQSEGLAVIDPETLPAADVADFIASLERH